MAASSADTRKRTAPSPPTVELRVAPDLITPEAARQVSEPRTLEHAILHGLWAFRMFMIKEVRKKISVAQLDPLTLNSMINDAWRVFMPSFGKITGPYIAAAYAEGFMKARAGRVPPEVLNALAQQYATQMGEYFHETSRDALMQGFNTYVNRKMPTRVAAERALEAYGLSPRQMGGYTSNTQMDQKVASGLATQAKEKLKSYIRKSLDQRFDLFARQETHNIEQQAQQVAWNYLVQHNNLPAEAEKVWFTARDERVCPSCGPMHGKRVPVSERFENGLYVPGVHVNCRCQVKLKVVPLRKDLEGAELEEFNRKHPRGEGGQFARKPRSAAERARATSPPPVAERDDLSALQRFLDTARVEEEPKGISMAPQQGISLGTAGISTPKMSSGVATGTGVSLGQKEKVATTGAGVGAAPKQGILTAQDKVVIQERTGMAIAQAVQQAPPKKRRFYQRPVIHLPQPVFAVAFADSFDADGKIDPVNITFTSNLEAVAQHASDSFHERMDEEYARVITENGGMIEMVGVDGIRYTAILDEDAVRGVVAYAAWGAPRDEGWVDITWQNADGNQFPDRVHADDIIEDWQLDPEFFEVTVMKLEEGHDSSLGVTHNLYEESRYGEEEWETSGTYLAETYQRDRSSMTAPLHFVNLIPDVEDIEIIDPDDWNE